jgi:hypothetical protein
MNWQQTNRADLRVGPLADRHYNRQSIGHRQFVPPGRCVVLHTEDYDAFWVTLYQLPQFTHHAWPGAWMCSAFRNEGSVLSSELIKEALQITCHLWGKPPPEGLITFVDPKKVRPKANPGYCFLRAGFTICGSTPKGLIVLRCAPENFPKGETI